MRYRNLFALILLVALPWLIPPSLWARPIRERDRDKDCWLLAKNYSDFDDEAEPEAEPSLEKRSRVEKRVQTMFIWRLTEVLDLDEKQEAKVIPVIKRYEGEIRQAIQKRHEVKRELRKALKDGKDDDAKRLLERFIGANDKIHQLQSQELSELKGLLTPIQLANYAIFREDFEREVREMIFAARHRSQDRGGHPPERRGNEPPEPSRMDE